MLAAVAIGLRAFQVSILHFPSSPSLHDIDLSQILFAIVVVGLAGTLISKQVYNSAPTTTKYSSFTGGFGIIVGAVGLAGLFIDKIPEIATMALDGLASIFFLAGGIAWAVGLKGFSCDSNSRDDVTKMLDNDLLNRGKIETGIGVTWGVFRDVDTSGEAFKLLEENCKKAFADEIFQFLAFALGLGLIGLGYVRMRKGGSTSYV